MMALTSETGSRPVMGNRGVHLGRQLEKFAGCMLLRKATTQFAVLEVLIVPHAASGVHKPQSG